MKSKVFKFSIFILLITFISFKKISAQNYCGTTAPANHSFAEIISSANSSQTTYSLPIHFYMFTSNGVLPGVYTVNGNLTDYNLVKHIRSAINFANTAFAPANINFYPSAFTFYESSTLFNKGNNVQALYNVIHDENAINVYIMNGYTDDQGNLLGEVGRAIYPDPDFPINNALSIQATNQQNFTHVLAHELGHYFNIMHTHDFTSYNLAPETNCNTQGDKICDTPPDAIIRDCPNLLFDCIGCGDCSNIPCVIKDKRTNPVTIINTFAPDKKNIMSYHNTCDLDHFSPMQLQKIYNELTTNSYRAFLIQGPNPPSVPLPSENAFVYRTNNSGTSPVVSQFGSMPVQLSKTGISPVTSTTPMAGGSLDVDKGIFLYQNITAKATPTRDGTGNLIPLNGVSTFDRIKIQQHILGTSLLPKPYAWIAADVTNNGVISSTDDIQIQKLILGHITAFTAVPSWRFVPTFALQNSVFLSEFNDDPFSAIWTNNGEYLGYNQAITGGTKTYFDDLEINLTNPNINQSSTFSFQAIKSGDINFSAVVNSNNNFRGESTIPELRTSEKYRLQSIDENCLEPGNSYVVSIAAQGNDAIYGYQMGLNFDPSLLTVSAVDKGEVNFFSLEPVKNYDNGEYERFLAACFSYFSARTRRVRPSK